jgi:hypothetical protein
MLDRNLELFKSTFCVATRKKIDGPGLRRCSGAIEVRNVAQTPAPLASRHAPRSHRGRSSSVIAGLDPAIHLLPKNVSCEEGWMPGSSPGTTGVSTVATDTCSRSRGLICPRFARNFPPSPIRGRRECRMRAAPAVSRAKQVTKTHTSIQVQRRQSDIPCAMALRLITRSPRRRIRLVTVIGELTASPRPVGPTRLRQLDTSNGCRNHTTSPYATTPFVCTPFDRSRVRLNPKPALPFTCAPDAAASTASRPASLTIRIRPSVGRDGEGYRFESGQPPRGIFS